MAAVHPHLPSYAGMHFTWTDAGSRPAPTSLSLCAPDRTLTENEVLAVRDAAIAEAAAVGAVLRGVPA